MSLCALHIIWAFVVHSLLVLERTGKQIEDSHYLYLSIPLACSMSGLAVSFLSLHPCMVSLKVQQVTVIDAVASVIHL